MATNPDVQGETELVPFLGMLRYVVTMAVIDGAPDVHRQLQQFQYSGSMNANDWYDVPEVMADSLTDPAVSEVTPIKPGTVTPTDKNFDPLVTIDASELTPAQTETEMIEAAKNAPVKVDRSPPHAT